MGIRNKFNVGLHSIPLSATRAILEQSVQDDLAQTGINKTDIANLVASLGAANGIATLDANANLNPTQVPSIAIGNTFAAADEAAMLTSPALDKTNTEVAKQMADVVIRSDRNGEAFRLTTNDPSVAANWVSLGRAEDGVTAIDRNGSMLTGAVPLAESAFTGKSVDVTYDNAVSGLAAENVKAAIDELKSGVNAEAQARGLAITAVQESVADEATARGEAVNNLQGQVDTLDGEKLSISNSKADVLFATATAANGTDTEFTVGESFIDGSLTVYLGPGRMREGDDYTMNGTVGTIAGVLLDQGEQVFGDYIKAAA